MRELALTRLGEMNAVGRAQTPGLAIEGGTARHEVAGLVDETIPNVDIISAHLARAFRQNLVEIDDVG